MKIKINGEFVKVENGLEDYRDLHQYAHDQYTEFGNVDKPKIRINIYEWFASGNNDDYLVESDNAKYLILVGNIPYTAYRKGDLKKHTYAVIGTIKTLVRRRGK